MSFPCFPPNFFSKNTVEKPSYFGSKFYEIFSKKNDLLFLSNKMINRNVVKDYQLFLSNSNKLSLFIPSKAKNNYNELTVNNIHLYFESCDKKTPKEIESIFLDCFHKNETSPEVKSILKNSGLESFEKKQLLSIWANQLLKKQAEIYDLIDLLDSDIYSNEALIVLGKKLIPLASKAPNKLQNLFNIYFKIGNCYSHENELKKALKQYKTAEKFLKYTIEKGLTDWINVYDGAYINNLVNKYDIYSTPVIYILDKNKTIKAKRIGIDQIENFLKIVK